MLRERFNEECARLAYVAVTRARRTVTAGLPRDMYYVGEVQKLIAQEWGRDTLVDDGIARVARARTPTVGATPTGWARPQPDTRLRTPETSGTIWRERQPSSAAAHLSVEERGQRADRVANLVRLANGLHVGGTSVDPPESAFAHLLSRDWGQIAHGWFAAWQFDGAPDRAHITRWLRSEWGDAPEGVSTWLFDLSRSMEDRGGPLWSLVTDPSAVIWYWERVF